MSAQKKILQADASAPAESRKALVVQLTADELREIVADAVRSAMKSAPRDDRLLTVEQACGILNCEKGWLYHQA
ncbi:MAG: hypothetical protein LUO89_06360, partial [Methanothrix sp.]|nr:hypothetical protein [Methanothrix sp.]